MDINIKKNGAKIFMFLEQIHLTMVVNYPFVF
jgi:hypothetical protein